MSCACQHPDCSFVLHGFAVRVSSLQSDQSTVSETYHPQTNTCTYRNAFVLMCASSTQKFGVNPAHAPQSSVTREGVEEHVGCCNISHAVQVGRPVHFIQAASAGTAPAHAHPLTFGSCQHTHMSPSSPREAEAETYIQLSASNSSVRTKAGSAASAPGPASSWA